MNAHRTIGIGLGLSLLFAVASSWSAQPAPSDFTTARHNNVREIAAVKLPLEWSKEITLLAEKKAHRCDFPKHSNLDDLRAALVKELNGKMKVGPLAENIAWIPAGDPTKVQGQVNTPEAAVEQAIRGWAAEVRLWDSKAKKCNQDPTFMKCGHYLTITNIGVFETKPGSGVFELKPVVFKFLGCGVEHCAAAQKYFVVCQYFGP